MTTFLLFIVLPLVHLSLKNTLLIAACLRNLYTWDHTAHFFYDFILWCTIPLKTQPSGCLEPYLVHSFSPLYRILLHELTTIHVCHSPLEGARVGFGVCYYRQCCYEHGSRAQRAKVCTVVLKL